MCLKIQLPALFNSDRTIWPPRTQQTLLQGPLWSQPCCLDLQPACCPAVCGLALSTEPGPLCPPSPPLGQTWWDVRIEGMVMPVCPQIKLKHMEVFHYNVQKTPPTHTRRRARTITSRIPLEMASSSVPEKAGALRDYVFKIKEKH